MQYTLRISTKDERIIDIPAGAEVVVILPTLLGLKAANGLESTVELPKVTAIMSEFSDRYAVVSGTVLRGEDATRNSDLAALPVFVERSAKASDRTL